MQAAAAAAPGRCYTPALWAHTPAATVASGRCRLRFRSLWMGCSIGYLRRIAGRATCPGSTPGVDPTTSNANQKIYQAMLQCYDAQLHATEDGPRPRNASCDGRLSVEMASVAMARPSVASVLVRAPPVRFRLRPLNWTQGPGGLRVSTRSRFTDNPGAQTDKTSIPPESDGMRATVPAGKPSRPQATVPAG
jgi:hypothetical protein